MRTCEHAFQHVLLSSKQSRIHHFSSGIQRSNRLVHPVGFETEHEQDLCVIRLSKKIHLLGKLHMHKLPCIAHYVLLNRLSLYNLIGTNLFAVWD